MSGRSPNSSSTFLRGRTIRHQRVRDQDQGAGVELTLLERVEIGRCIILVGVPCLLTCCSAIFVWIECEYRGRSSGVENCLRMA